MFPGRVIAGFDQPLTLAFALLLDLADCIPAEVYPVAAVAEVGREKHLLRHSGSLAEDGGVFNRREKVAAWERKGGGEPFSREMVLERR